MKRIIINLITVYQKVVSPLLHQLLGVQSGCRYEKSCSVYAKESIAKYGAGKGVFMSVRRLLSCQPFFSL